MAEPFDPNDITADILKGAISSSGKKIRPKQTTPKATAPMVLKKEATKMVEEAMHNGRWDLTEKGEAILRDKRHSIKAVYEAFKQFETAVGGRRKLIETLKHCPETSLGYGLMSRLLADPEFLASTEDDEMKRKSLSLLCGKKKISLPVLVAAFRDAKTAELAIQALIGVSDHVPKVTEQMAQDAQNRYVHCEVCRGKGRVNRIGEDGEWALDANGFYLTQLCFACRGEGTVWAKHDFNNRKALLEFTGILTKGPIISNTIDNRSVNLQGVPGDGSFEGIMKSLDVMVRGTRPSDPTTEPSAVIEATIVDEEA